MAGSNLSSPDITREGLVFRWEFHDFIVFKVGA